MILVGKEPAALPDTSILITARYSGYVELDHYMNPEHRLYDLSPGRMCYGYYASFEPPVEVTWSSFLCFDLAAIPDTAGITGASISFYQYEDTFSPALVIPRVLECRNWYAESVYAAIGRGARAGPDYTCAPGWNRFALNDTGVEALQSALSSDSISFALAWTFGFQEGQAYGFDAPESLRPRLEVNYVPSGITGAGSQVLSRPLHVMPNPASRAATISWPGNHSGQLFVVIYDRSGRVIMRRTAATVGLIDLGGLTSGIYMVVVSDGSAVARSRLVVVRR